MDGEDWDDPDNPFNAGSGGITDEELRKSVQSDAEALRGIEEAGAFWRLGDSIEISKTQPSYRWGWHFEFTEVSAYLKRAFDFPGRKGIAVVFRGFEPRPGPGMPSEHYIGWVPADREAELDGWIAFLNNEIKARLAATPAAEAATMTRERPARS